MVYDIITPNLEDIMGVTDSESIQNAVEFAHKTGANSVTVPRINKRTGECVWNIDRAIILPSDMEIVLDNCHLRQTDRCFDNIFRNFADTERDGHTVAEQMRNIVIRGRGRAVLDGGNHNGLTSKTQLKDGLPHVTRNNLILLYNIRDFVIENFEMRNQRYWGLNLIHAQRGRISNLYIDGECDCRNQDGIDLRAGCSDIIIEKITGQAGDDLIALSAISNHPRTACSEVYKVYARDEDIHDIIIRDVIGSSVECAVIALRNSDGKKIYNITMDNIHCTDNYARQDGKLYPEYPKFKLNTKNILHRIRVSNMPYALIRVGHDGFYCERPAAPGEMYNIHATNLHTHIGCVVLANVALDNSYFGNIYADNDVDYILSTKGEKETSPFGAAFTNVVFENIFYNNRDNDYATAFDLDINQKMYKAENLFIRRAFLGNCKKIFNMKCDGEIKYSDIHGTYVESEAGILKADKYYSNYGIYNGGSGVI